MRVGVDFLLLTTYYLQLTTYLEVGHAVAVRVGVDLLLTTHYLLLTTYLEVGHAVAVRVGVVVSSK